MNGELNIGVMDVLSYVFFFLFIAASILSFFIGPAIIFAIFCGANFIVAEVAINRNMLKKLQESINRLEKTDSEVKE